MSIQQLEQAVGARDARAAARLLRGLNSEKVALGETYDRLRALEPELVALLFAELEPAEFGQLVAGSDHLLNTVVWQTLESIGVDAEILWALREPLGLPDPDRCPGLHTTLVAADGETFSQRLVDTIEQLVVSGARESASLSTHERTLSRFRTRQWAPDHRGLVEVVTLLAARPDPVAREAVRRYLLSLPWGADRQATRTLLQVMDDWPREERQTLLQKALAAHRQPAVLRIWLWQAIGSAEPRASLAGMLEDLAATTDDADRLLYIESLDATLAGLAFQGTSFHGSGIAALAEQLDTRHWFWLTRGYYGALIASRLGANARRVSGALDLAGISLIHAWERVRLDHTGCVVWLALIVVGAQLLNAGLDWWLGPPTVHGWLPVTLFAGWLLWALITVETHFSGHENLRFRWRASLGYFGLLAGTLLSALLVRIW